MEEILERGEEEREGGLEKKEKIFLNLSPSSINIYYQSPLLFYLTYIKRAPDDTKVPLCYGLSGNIVHECLEKYALGQITQDQAYAYLLSQWEKNGLHLHKDINGQVLNPLDYINALIRGIEVVNKHNNHLCEERITLPLIENQEIRIGIKGIIDLQATEKVSEEYTIIDYKTSNGISENDGFRRQALFYNLLVHKKKNIVPKKTSFHYLKHGVIKEYRFTIEEIENFEEELVRIANNILSWGTNIENYPIGEIEDLFNSKKGACLKEIERRKKENKSG